MNTLYDDDDIIIMLLLIGGVLVQPEPQLLSVII